MGNQIRERRDIGSSHLLDYNINTHQSTNYWQHEFDNSNQSLLR